MYRISEWKNLRKIQFPYAPLLMPERERVSFLRTEKIHPDAARLIRRATIKDWARCAASWCNGLVAIAFPLGPEPNARLWGKKTFDPDAGHDRGRWERNCRDL